MSNTTDHGAPTPTPTQGSGAFPGTRWSLVVAARDGSDDSRFSALSELCEIYWYPIYSYLRRNGRTPEDAEDITQGFLANLLRRDDLERVRKELGKMRSFLLGSLKHFLASRYHHETRQKRGGKNLQLVSIEHEVAEQRFKNEPQDGDDPVKIFDQQWAISLMNRVFERMRDENTSGGQSEVFEALSPYLAGGDERGDYARISEELGISEAALRVTVYRWRKRYRQILEQEVLQTLADPEQLEEEIRHLLSVFD